MELASWKTSIDILSKILALVKGHFEITIKLIIKFDLMFVGSQLIYLDRECFTCKQKEIVEIRKIH